MNARLARLLTLWIVPLLLARAFIPAGFMLAAEGGSLSLAFCSGVAAPTAPQHAGDEGHHDAARHAGHPGHDGQEGRGMEHESGPCPYSLGAAAAFAEVSRVASAAFVLSDEVVEFDSARTPSVGPLHSNRIRGPPPLA